MEGHWRGHGVVDSVRHITGDSIVAISKLFNLGAKQIAYSLRDAKVLIPVSKVKNAYQFSLDSATKITAEMALDGYINPVVSLEGDEGFLVFSKQAEPKTEKAAPKP